MSKKEYEDYRKFIATIQQAPLQDRLLFAFRLCFRFKWKEAAQVLDITENNAQNSYSQSVDRLIKKYLKNKKK